MADGLVEPRGPASVDVILPTGARVTCDVTKETTIGDLISEVCATAPAPADRTPSMVYRGRILESSELVSQLDTLEMFTMQLFYRAVRPAARDPPAGDLRGFDRLQRMDYPEDQIAEMRHHFHAMHGTEDATADARLEAEEEWFPVIFNQENPLHAMQFRPFLDPARGRRRPRPHPPARENDNPIAQNGEAAGEDEDNSSWLRGFFGLVIGLIFGASALVFILLCLHDATFMFGLVLGVLGHYAIRYGMGLGVV